MLGFRRVITKMSQIINLSLLFMLIATHCEINASELFEKAANLCAATMSACTKINCSTGGREAAAFLAENVDIIVKNLKTVSGELETLRNESGTSYKNAKKWGLPDGAWTKILDLTKEVEDLRSRINEVKSAPKLTNEQSLLLGITPSDFKLKDQIKELESLEHQLLDLRKKVADFEENAGLVDAQVDSAIKEIKNTVSALKMYADQARVIVKLFSSDIHNLSIRVGGTDPDINNRATLYATDNDFFHNPGNIAIGPIVQELVSARALRSFTLKVRNDAKKPEYSKITFYIEYYTERDKPDLVKVYHLDTGLSDGFRIGSFKKEGLGYPAFWNYSSFDNSVKPWKISNFDVDWSKFFDIEGFGLTQSVVIEKIDLEILK